MRNQYSLVDDLRMTLDDSIQLSLASLEEYGRRYRHWAIAFSGGKDSTATLAFVWWAVGHGLVSTPNSISVLYADTRQELPPLAQAAQQIIDDLNFAGGVWSAQTVLPAIDERFYVYMFGRGVPAPKNRFRWCTPQIKVEPMMHALADVRERAGEKILMLTGVRIGESAVRDARIALSCSKDSGECGQGWFQTATDSAVADTLAPLLHWRLCHVYDWLYLDDRHNLDVSGVAAVYGESDVRTGCVGCNLVDEDTALLRLIKLPQWEHLRPLLELKELYREMQKPQYRKRKVNAEALRGGGWGKNPQRMGPYTMAARAYGLERVLDIQARAGVDLINAEEETRIRELWALDTWPQKWSSQDVDANVPIDGLVADGERLFVQPLLVR